LTNGAQDRYHNEGALDRYKDARPMMKPGDVIAFGGKGRFSQLIKRVTRSPVSHIGVIRQARLRSESGPSTVMVRFFNELIESTSLEDYVGVITSRLSHRVWQYNGEVWWLPLSPEARSRFDEEAYFNWLYDQEGKEYDTFGAAMSVMDGWAREDYDKLFCSELAAGALKAAGILPEKTNASTVTPADLCQLSIYHQGMADGKPVQLKGEPMEIPGFNQRLPLEE
jgi:hypothetical protein